MRFIHAITIATLAGSAASAQPVARHLLDDANVVETLYSEPGNGPSVTNYGSLQVLDDLDGDGVLEVLLMHARAVPDLQDQFQDFFLSKVLSPRTGITLVEFARPVLPRIGLAHYDAVMIDDVNGDGVRDIAVSRRLQSGALLRVYSGDTGEVIRESFGDEPNFSWGFSLLPWDDMDGDGQPDLIASRVGYGSAASTFISWSPGSGAVGEFSVDGDNAGGSLIPAGRAMLDLGIGATGTREFLASFLGAAGGAAALFGGDPVGSRGLYSPGQTSLNDGLVDGGAVRIGDLNNDGHREIVVTGRWPDPHNAQRFGLPVLSGALPAVVGTHVDAYTTQSPRIVIDVQGTPMKIDAVANHTVVELGDATGDGFQDYTLVGVISDPEVDPAVQYIVTVCGRTGRAFFATQVDSISGAVSAEVIPLVIGGNSRVRDSVVSPGDLNNDGAPDLLVLVYRRDVGDGSEDPIREQLLLTHYLPTPCVGDVDFDRVVNFGDLNAVLSNFGAQDITLPADLNASGVVDFADLNLVLSAFGASCD